MRPDFMQPLLAPPRYAGGNGIMFALGSPIGGGTTPEATMAGGNTSVQNSSGGAAPLGHVQIAIGAALLLSLAVLVVLNKAGFRFSVTVG